MRIGKNGVIIVHGGGDPRAGIAMDGRREPTAPRCGSMGAMAHLAPSENPVGSRPGLWMTTPFTTGVSICLVPILSAIAGCGSDQAAPMATPTGNSGAGQPAATAAPTATPTASTTPGGGPGGAGDEGTPPEVGDSPCPASAEGIVREGSNLRTDPMPFLLRATGDDGTYHPILLPEAAPRLDLLAAYLRSCPDLAIEIQVHTGPVGTQGFNARASQDVAEQLAAALIERGIAGERLTPCGYGESRPAERGEGERVEVLVLDGPADGRSCPRE